MQRQGSQLASHEYKLWANFFASKYFENYPERPYTQSLKRKGYVAVVYSVPLPLNRSEAGGDPVFFNKPSRFSKCRRIARYAAWKAGRFLTWQGHPQPRFYSKATVMSTQLSNGLFANNFDLVITNFSVLIAKKSTLPAVISLNLLHESIYTYVKSRRV